MKKKKKTQEVDEVPAVQAEADASKKVSKKARKAAEKEVVAETDAGTEETRARKKARKAAEEEAVAETAAVTEDTQAPKKARKAAETEAAAVGEPATAQQDQAKVSSKAAKKARKKARIAAAKLSKTGSQNSKKALKAAAWKESLQGTISKKTSKPDATKSDSDIAKDDAKGADADKENSLTVFVGGFPFETSEAKLREDFEECGEITKFVVPKDAEGKRRGIAFVTFKTKTGVEAACKFDRSDYGGRVLMVNKVGPIKTATGGKGKGKGESGPASFDHEVCVRGLPWSTTSEQLRTHFETCGAVTNLKLLYNEEGKVRGSAFIAFQSEEGLQKALKFNETEYGGRSIYVSKPGEGKDGKGKGKGKGKDKGKGKGKKGKA